MQQKIKENARASERKAQRGGEGGGGALSGQALPNAEVAGRKCTRAAFLGTCHDWALPGSFRVSMSSVYAGHGRKGVGVLASLVALLVCLLSFPLLLSFFASNI